MFGNIQENKRRKGSHISAGNDAMVECGILRPSQTGRRIQDSGNITCTRVHDATDHVQAPRSTVMSFPTSGVRLLYFRRSIYYHAHFNVIYEFVRSGSARVNNYLFSPSHLTQLGFICRTFEILKETTVNNKTALRQDKQNSMHVALRALGISPTIGGNCVTGRKYLQGVKLSHCYGVVILRSQSFTYTSTWSSYQYHP